MTEHYNTESAENNHASLLRKMRVEDGYHIGDLRPDVRNKVFRVAVERGDIKALRELRRGWGFTYRDVCNKTDIKLPASRDNHIELLYELQDWGFVP